MLRARHDVFRSSVWTAGRVRRQHGRILAAATAVYYAGRAVRKKHPRVGGAKPIATTNLRKNGVLAALALSSSPLPVSYRMTAGAARVQCGNPLSGVRGVCCGYVATALFTRELLAALDEEAESIIGSWRRLSDRLLR